LTEVSSDSGVNVLPVKETDSSGSVVTKYYRVDLKSSTYGSGSNTKYYKWQKIGGYRIRLIETTNVSEAVLTLKYNTVADIKVASGTVLASVTSDILGQNIKNKIDTF
jgi:hypothetical protein